MRPCPECGHDLDERAKFCSECGAVVLPGAVRAPPAERESELRQLTALFCDLVGSTEMSSRMDAEGFGQLIHVYLRRAAEEVQRYEGEVGRYVGDAILAHFGWPEAHDDDAERAVRAALDIVAAIDSLNEELGADTELSVRVGVHTGPVLIGEIERAHQREMMALGETMNLASRLQDIAEPNAVVISATTLELVKGIFVTQPLEARTLKGIPQPVVAHRVLQATGVRSRLDASGDTLTALVARKREMSTLAERWQHVREGSCQAVLITGEAGVGKSRLAYELRRLVRDEPHSWMEARCSSYTQNSAFRPAAELIEMGLRLEPRDGPQEKLAKLQRGLTAAGIDDEQALSLLAPLVSIPGPEVPLTMSLELRRRRTLELLSRWIAALAGGQPMVLLVEDVHWADPSSLELLGALMDMEVALLLVVTARPEFASPWEAGDALTVVTLDPLDELDARALVEGLAGGRELPAAVRDRIVSASDGIPLYIEEVGRTVLESAALGEDDPAAMFGDHPEDVEIPTSLQACLMARLDRLSAAKRVAQRAAVIGREFDHDLLEQVAGVEPVALRHGVDLLVESELLFRRGDPPDATYTFKHALIQDAAYQSMLKRTRVELHERIARILETRPADDASAAPEIVAHHYHAAGRLELAVANYRRAAEQVARRSGHPEAVAHLRLAIELLGELPPARALNAIELDIQMLLASSVMATRSYGHPEVRTAYERARELSATLQDDVQLGHALAGLSIVYSNEGELQEGEQLAQEVLEIAERVDDDSLRLLAHIQLAVPTCYSGRFAEALEHCDRAIQIYDRDRHGWIAFRFGTDHGVAAHGLASLALCLLGCTEQGLARAREAIDLARSLGQPFNVAYALTAAAVAHWVRGDLAAQEETGKQIEAISEEQAFEFWTGIGRIFHWGARAISTRNPSAIPELIGGTVISARSGVRGAVPALLAMMAEAHMAVGDMGSAAGTVEGALSLSAATGQTSWDSRLLSLKGTLALAARDRPERDRLAEAERCYRQAIEVASAQSGRLEELRAATMLTELLCRQGNRPQAALLLQGAYERLPERSNIADVERARRLLAELTDVPDTHGTTALH